jgi:hypothetical protein
MTPGGSLNGTLVFSSSPSGSPFDHGDGTFTGQLNDNSLSLNIAADVYAGSPCRFSGSVALTRETLTPLSQDVLAARTFSEEVLLDLAD